MFKNPITIWLNWLIQSIILKRKFKTLSIGYLAQISNSTFQHNNLVCEYAILSKVQMNNYSYVGVRSQVKNAMIGSFCSIAPDCIIGLGAHPMKYVSTHPVFYARKGHWDFEPANNVFYEEYKKISIGNDVWVGARAVIVDGVSIGNGAIIAAGAVVTKDVPPYAIVGGVPAKIIKYRFSKDIINELESSLWWEWDIATIKAKRSKFLNVEEFLKG